MRKAALLWQMKMVSPMEVSLGREAKVREGFDWKRRIPLTVLREGRLMVVKAALLPKLRSPPAYVSSDDATAVAEDENITTFPEKRLQVGKPCQQSPPKQPGQIFWAAQLRSEVKVAATVSNWSEVHTV
jgi:hypothetical protein